MKTLMRKFLSEEQGTVSIEYAILLGMIVVGLVLVIAAVGAWVKARWDALQTDLGA